MKYILVIENETRQLHISEIISLTVLIQIQVTTCHHTNTNNTTKQLTMKNECWRSKVPKKGRVASFGIFEEAKQTNEWIRKSLRETRHKGYMTDTRRLQVECVYVTTNDKS